MKWENRGHEYERFCTIFSKGKKLYIYGAGENGKDLFGRLKFADCVEGFIDNDEGKQSHLFEGKPVYSIVDFMNQGCKDCIIVVAQSLSNTVQTMAQMLQLGYKEGENLFDYHVFIDFYLPIYAWYAHEKTYISTISFLMTTVCNLDCIGCLNFNHFNDHRRHYSIERLKSDIDLLFQKIDYVGLLHLCGGEPFMYPHFVQLINYINEKYREKIYQLGSTTNATIIPNDMLCEAMSRAQMTVWIDNYTKNVPLAKENRGTVENTLREKGIQVCYQDAEQWIQLYNDQLENDEMKLMTKCSCCNVPFVSFKEGKMYGCNYCDYAIEASVVPVKETDYLNLKDLNEYQGIEIVEYANGYSKTGYYSLCKHCNGFSTISEKGIEVAAQWGK
ncbi:MAG: radical SAM protein [Agathobacter sp.]